jgi:hypothetical protein
MEKLGDQCNIVFADIVYIYHLHRKATVCLLEDVTATCTSPISHHIFQLTPVVAQKRRYRLGLLEFLHASILQKGKLLYNKRQMA